MSVYRPKDKHGKLAAIYVYDFRLDGRRLHGSTGATTRGEARAEERRVKDRERERAKEAATARAAPMTIDVAADRFWEETGQHYRGNAGVTFEASLAWLVAQLGRNTPIQDITNSRVAEMVARRRGEGVKNATVNRTVTEPLRRIFRRAVRAWDQAVQPIRWGEHLLAEPRERVRSASVDEEKRLLASLPEDYRPVVAFALASGFRLAECVGMTWQAIDWTGGRVTVRGKGDKPATLPLSSTMRTILLPLRGQHATAVFTYRAARTVMRHREVHREAGRRYPITYEGMKTEWRRAERNVPDFRFHDLRHTAATRLLRSGANLRVVQKLLRHEEIATTAKYAHADDEDLRAAMEREANSRGISHAKTRGAA